MKYLGSMILYFVTAVATSAVAMQLNYGANSLDLNADGQTDLIVRTRWDNNNAHSYDRYTVAIQNKQGVFVEVAVNGLKDGLSTFEAADCETKDDASWHTYLSFELDVYGKIVLKRYSNAMMGGKASDVTLDRYVLREDRTGEVGTANYALIKETSEKLSAVCDVREISL